MDSPQVSPAQSHSSSNRNKLIAVLAAVLVAAGGYLLVLTKASGFFASVDPTVSALGGNASIITANDGTRALQFNAGSIPPVTPPGSSADLSDPKKKDIAMQLVSAAENSSLDWKAQYSYIEYNVEGNAAENRGYTGGLVGFTSATGDMLDLVTYYKQIAPGNILEKYLPALQKVNGSSSQTGLGNAFVNDWKAAANNADGKFKAAQDHERDRVYFDPALALAKQDGLRALGQFAYYDAGVMHGTDNWGGGLPNIRAAALKKAKTPAQGGDEKTYLNAFLDARKAEMLKETAHDDTSRVDTEQRKFLNEGNLDLNTPLTFSTYGDPYTIK